MYIYLQSSGFKKIDPSVTCRHSSRMELSYILASIAFVLFLLYFYLSWQYNYWQRRGIPSAKGTIPGLGHMLPVFTVQKSMGTLGEDIYKEGKNYSMIGFYRLFTPLLLIRDPELVKNVLLTNFSSFSENPFKINCLEKDELISLNPFFVNGEKWKQARAPLTNSFSSMKLKMMLSLVLNVGSKLSNYLHNQCKDNNDKIDLNLKKLCHKFTGEISSTGMGIEAHNFQEELQPKNGEMTYNQIINKIFDNPSLNTGIHQMIMFFMPTLAKLFKLSITPKEVDQYFRQIAKTIINNRKKEKRTYNDFMQIVLDYQKTHDSNMHEETLAAAHMLSFAADVYETSAITMSFLIMDIASRPEIQEKVRNEIVSLLKKYNGELTYDALKEMTYLEKVLNESQRMNHIGGTFFKICTKKIKLEGNDGLSCVIKPGQTVAFSAYGLQMDSKYWQEPEKFNPERFNEDEKNNRHKFTFLPFGEGPRICVGMRMAAILIKVAVFTIIKDFSVEVSPKMIFPIERDESSFLNSPKGGFWVTIKPLKSTR
ncbi:cytochrome P450 6B4-like [Leptopilina boulardi]|uniref:cytochrome P450 6B4-like n=1 Tax=Leptopilina boulardi TaxID=63433 RepID=UPI0021F62809|nr:cytochrome P450 6B4-like [Leptopilina boulardi]